MAAFPPVSEARWSDVPEKGRPPVLNYMEDDIRDALLQKFPLLYKLPVNLLTTEDIQKTKSAGFPSLNTLVEKYKEFIKVHEDSEAAMEKTVGWVMSEMQDAKMKRLWAKQIKNLKRHEKEQAYIDNDSNQKDANNSIDIAELFKLSSSNKSKNEHK